MSDTSPTPEQVAAGHAFYTKRSLAVYDLLILGFFCRFVWKCPSPRVLEHYDRHVSANHLDIGVGTGYFLDRCRYPADAPRLALLDINQACLDVAERRLSRYQPETHLANVLEPVTLDAPKFDSVGMNGLLHCLPGTIRAKALVFDHVKALANPGAVVFGATLLYGGVDCSRIARGIMNGNNRRGIFTNRSDDLDGLREVLSGQLSEPHVDVAGCMALFSGRV